MKHLNIEIKAKCLNHEQIRKILKGPKQSNVILFKYKPNSFLKEILAKSLGILVVVDKQREIYFIDNVKFHLDTVKNLGAFIEIEAININKNIGKVKLLEQCRFYLDLFQISKDNLISVSYSDLLLKQSETLDKK
ncbi:MAG: CYTH domain-containing protein [Armatimonadetes bacterium]|nr:CYTH domain-containing protein [Armatimonadota bacterium]